MDKFSKKIKRKDKLPKENKVLFDNDWIKLTEFEDWTVLEETDTVACIPYLIEYNEFIVRQEVVPSYKLKNGKDYHVTLVAGGIEEDETPEEAMKRELEEEAGIVLRDGYEIEMSKPLFKSKSGSSYFYYCIIPITESDYHEVVAKGDGSVSEKLSKSVKLNVKHINNVLSSDTITELVLCKLKDYLNI